MPFIEFYCFQLYCPTLHTKIILNTSGTFVKGKVHLVVFEGKGFLFCFTRYEAAALPILESSTGKIEYVFSVHKLGVNIAGYSLPTLLFTMYIS